MGFFSRKVNRSINANEIVFQENGTIDVTNFDAMSPEDPLGYLCECEILVFSNGQLQINSRDEKREVLESFSVLSIIRANNNINNFDPTYSNTVSIITEKKDLKISFRSLETKNRFWKSLTTVYDSLKKE